MPFYFDRGPSAGGGGGSPGATGATGPAGPSGPTGPAGTPSMSGTAGEQIYAGHPVYISEVDGQIYVASNLLTEECRVLGLASVDAAAGTTVQFLPNGRIDVADWTNVLGSTRLVVGKTYFLSDGGLTATVPTTGFVMQIGIAVTRNMMNIDLKTRVHI